jgi:hypothetical protein
MGCGKMRLQACHELCRINFTGTAGYSRRWLIFKGGTICQRRQRMLERSTDCEMTTPCGRRACYSWLDLDRQLLRCAMSERLEILILQSQPERVAATVADHLEALTTQSRHHVRQVAILGDAPPALDFDRFDVIILHYSLVVAHDGYVTPGLRARLRACRALKAVFIQDEYRHIDATVRAFQEIGLDVLFTCMPDEAIEAVYPANKLPGVTKLNVLTGYVPEALLARTVLPLAARRIDVGYRARMVPAWLGDLGQEKWHIGRRFARDAPAYGLRCDVAYREEERLYGEDWIQFVMNCKAMLGVESGSSVFDFTGTIQAAVDRDATAEPGISYDELKRRHFAAEDGRINQRQISPRVFESAALRTLLVLYEGAYSGILVPGRHYVALAKDHSNMADVAAIINDPAQAQMIVDNAYREIACNPAYQFSAHATFVDGALAIACAGRDKVATRPGAAYDTDSFLASCRPHPKTRRRLIMRRVITYAHYMFYGVLLRPLSETRRDIVARRVRLMLMPIARRARSMLGTR